MNKSVRRVLYRFLPGRLVLVLLILFASRKAGIVRDWGWARSIRLIRPADTSGRPLPWPPYCFTELLIERLTPDLHVLEFGAGNSTLFFMQRVASVTSVEHHEHWLKTVRARAAGNVTLLSTSKQSADEYVAPVRALDRRFDLILVDGRHRVACFDVALQRLSGAGVIMLDDSDRPEYADIFPRAAAAGFRTLHLRGHRPDSMDLHRTSIFYKDGNCLGL